MTLRVLAGIEETRVDVRAALVAELPLDPNTPGARKSLALLLSAWESARAQLQLTEKQKLEAKMTNQTRLLQTSEHHAMRIAVEKVTGKLRDKEASSKQLISVRLEQVPQAEDLKEVTSLDEGEIESLAATIDPASATLRIRSGKKTVATPKNAEELRLRHRRIGFCGNIQNISRLDHGCAGCRS